MYDGWYARVFVLPECVNFFNIQLHSMLNIEFYMLQNEKEIHACVSSRTTKQPQKYKSSLALTSAS